MQNKPQKVIKSKHNRGKSEIKYVKSKVPVQNIRKYNKNINHIRQLSQTQTINNNGIKCFCNCKMKLMQKYKQNMKIKCQKCCNKVPLWEWYYQCNNYAIHDKKIAICAKCIKVMGTTLGAPTSDLVKIPGLYIYIFKNILIHYYLN